ncbi:hypothetical protein [Psychromonas arctica]|uniref:hypothetical protein n=1 Tax=Psychromonas arctica TaxID=168275 RepID=UPI002FD0A83C
MSKRASLLIIISIFFISMASKASQNIKAFVSGHNSNYDVQLKINGKPVGKGAVSGLKIFNEENPLKNQFQDMPPFVQDILAFVLKEGENTIELKFDRKRANFSPPRKFSFGLTSSTEYIPFYYVSSEKESGVITSKFYLNYTKERPEKEQITLGNKDAAFIYSERMSSFQATLNDESLMYFGGSGGLTDLNLIKGTNILQVQYETEHEGEISYYIQTPSFTKKVVKNISKDQVNKAQTDIYELKK